MLVACILHNLCGAAPGGGQRSVVTEDQLLDREEAMFGDNAEHLREANERGDVALDAAELERASEVLAPASQLSLLI